MEHSLKQFNKHQPVMKDIPVGDLYPLETSCVPDSFVKKAEEELHETESLRAAALKSLRECVLNDKGLSCRSSDDFLIQFLRARKFDVPRAHSLVKKYMAYKEKHPDLFNVDKDAMEKLVRNGTFGFLPYRCTDGCAVMVLDADTWDPHEVGFKDFCRAYMLFLYHSVNDPMSQINGYKLIFNVKSRGLKHMRFATPYNIYLLYSGTQECFPGRYKGIHFLNISPVFQLAWSIVYPFLSEKFKSRVVMHKEYKTLQNYFPESMIPKRYGGLLEDFDTMPWLTNALSEENLQRLAH